MIPSTLRMKEATIQSGDGIMNPEFRRLRAAEAREAISPFPSTLRMKEATIKSGDGIVNPDLLKP